MKTCTIEGCAKKLRARGMCQMHYDAARYIPAPTKPVRICGKDSCTAPHYCRGLCKRHYSTWRARTGGPSPKTCEVADCNKLASTRGWCTNHYSRWRKYGNPLRGNPSRSWRAVDHEDGTRTCLRCDQRLPLDTDHFYRDNKASTGYRSRCIRCHRTANNEWYASHKDQVAAYAEKNKEHIKSRARKRYADNRERLLPIMSAYTHLRRKRVAESDPVQGITISALRERHGGHCCYCGIQMTFKPARKREYIPTKATLEHVIPISRHGLHDWYNTRLCCWECNTRKNNKTAEEWLSKVGWLPFDSTVLNITIEAA